MTFPQIYNKYRTLLSKSVIVHVILFSLNVFYFPIVFVCFLHIYKHIQFNTISCKQKGKKVKPHVLKQLIYGSPPSIIL